jgi:fructokinase
MPKLFGGIEAGGTKFRCMAASDPYHIAAEISFPTTHPAETLRGVADFFGPFVHRGELQAVGIGSFGPVDLDPASPTYGYIITTPKAGWARVDLVGAIRQALRRPVAFDTDVNAAAIGEYHWTPSNAGRDPFVYITVGTGIGVGVIANGRPVHGLIHTEAGHMVIPHNPQIDPFDGICPFHGDCLEGLASGPAMARRWGRPAEQLDADHKGWELEADYLALAIANLVYVYSPQRIILGGGVSQHAGLHILVRQKVQRVLNGYIHSPVILGDISEYIIPPTLGKDSGVLGAIAMARSLPEVSEPAAATHPS